MMFFTILWILRMNSTSRGFSPCPVGAMKYRHACTLLSGTLESKCYEQKYSEYLANLHPGDPGLGLKEVIELVLDVLKNRRPAVGVVDCIAIPGGVDHSQGQLHSVLLQLTVVCLHLGGVLEQSQDDLP